MVCAFACHRLLCGFRRSSYGVEASDDKDSRILPGPIGHVDGSTVVQLIAIPEEDVLKNLTVPTVFISGTKDQWINPEKVALLEDITERYELPLVSIKYEADHAFFNDTRAEVYNETAAKDAWALATGFFNDNL